MPSTRIVEAIGIFKDGQSAARRMGQRRQLEVAVALTMQPKLFVMDEPMAGLGAEGSGQMITLLDQLRH